MQSVRDKTQGLAYNLGRGTWMSQVSCKHWHYFQWFVCGPWLHRCTENLALIVKDFLCLCNPSGGAVQTSSPGLCISSMAATRSHMHPEYWAPLCESWPGCERCAKLVYTPASLLNQDEMSQNGFAWIEEWLGTKGKMRIRQWMMYVTQKDAFFCDFVYAAQNLYFVLHFGTVNCSFFVCLTITSNHKVNLIAFQLLRSESIFAGLLHFEISGPQMTFSVSTVLFLL